MLLTLQNFLSHSVDESIKWQSFSAQLNADVYVESPLEGVLIFRPTGNLPQQKHIVLSSGIHGNETAPMEICNQLIADIASGKLKISHALMFIFGNLPAIKQQTRFIEENLNRLFAPNIEGDSLEVPRAKALMQQVSAFFKDATGERYHYDLHTAIRASKNEKFAVYPHLHGKAHSKTELQFMSDCGVNTILLSQSATTTFSYYSSRYHDAHAFTVELGKVKAFGQNNMNDFVQADKMLRHLIADRELTLSAYEDCPLEIYKVNQVINKHHADFKLHFSEDTANFTDYCAGTLLASESGAKYYAQQDGEAIVFPNENVAIGQRALLTVVPCEL
ncbi:succinylglutamate desuccinylase [Glaciecola siphonariae]|uniref:Succinylglutamate desuccinylase n=1 Tax=Glaciecola siphonariae TaxID=521012 RepID=A0ABV9LV86_9ALTE